ncbi:TRAP transporter fused permease subunit [Maritimibacter sp. UBA3975]|uniref:TRAP transporter permease n=1 Tax=Maritimibacter sp. UBA3975 TaxID=1946833 RepID=UPI000C0A7396|nr:TRAP transporter fused permease subunit [Maritimibacter sp. UBA3975]MAM61546.1 TRAP transporter permease DctM/Q [Maritimibacter sp.]|tara:strand:- start:22966 stop:24882 length:1917 start_codon:yes stop_codon:yes gene_type:complete
MRAVAAVLAASLPVLGIAWTFNLPEMIGQVYITEQYLAVILGLTIMAGLMVKRQPPVPMVADLVFGLAALAGWWWLAINYQDWLLDPVNRGPEKWVPAVVGILGLFEATRRHCGLVLSLLGVGFMLYGFFGHFAPGIFEAAYLTPPRYLLYVYNDSNGVPGLVLGVGATQILGFIIFGAVLTAVGGSAAMTDLAMAAMGHRRGGPAKVAILASSLFGTLSGSTVANVMSTGVVTIPMMKKSGWPARHAGAIEAVASNGGQIAPPVMGATAFIIAEFLQISYTDVVIAALLPAAFYYLLLYRQVDSYAAANGLHGEPRESLPRLGAALKGSTPLILPLGVLIYFLFWLGYAPGKSALYASGAALALYLATGLRLISGLRELPGILVRAGETLIPILLVCAIAGIIIGTINVTGLGFALTLALGKIAELGGVLPLLATTAVIAIVLGVGMPTSGVYVVVAVLLAPALVRNGINITAAHLFILYFGLLSMLTPPVAIASYAAASIAKSDMWQTGVTGVRLAFVAYLLPFVFAFNPALIMEGTWFQIAVSCATVYAGGHVLAEVLARKSAFGGGFLRLFASLGGLLLFSATAIVNPTHPIAIAAAIAGIALLFLLAWQSRRAAAQPTFSRETLENGAPDARS